MELVLTEWLSMGLRWLHVVAGIAWIGSSFYFVHLDLSLRARQGLPAGAGGEAWQVHGGGFYNMVKYLVAPARLPPELTWFKWEAYTTWLSGAALLVVVYYLSAELLLIDKAVLDLTPGMAIGLSVGGVVVAWLAYEGLCRSPLGQSEVPLALAGYVFLVALCFAFTRIFSGRGAFLEIGALIGTMMVANVFVVIIPNQKKVVAALLAGQTPDPRLGAQAKQRSVHNNYLTLPVVFLMISNHYPLFYATRFNWVMVAILLPMGFVIRHFFNCRHAGKPTPWWTWIVAAAGMVAIAWLSWAGARITIAAAAPPVTFAAAQDIIQTRCVVCHAAEPVWAGIVTAPRGVLLDTPDGIRLHAGDIAAAAVMSNAMPPGNVTEISDADRVTLAGWIAAGAPMK